MADLTSLPPEMQEHVASFVPKYDLLNLRQTNRQMHQACEAHFSRSFFIFRRHLYTLPSLTVLESISKEPRLLKKFERLELLQPNTGEGDRPEHQARSANIDWDAWKADAWLLEDHGFASLENIFNNLRHHGHRPHIVVRSSSKPDQEDAYGHKRYSNGARTAGLARDHDELFDHRASYTSEFVDLATNHVVHALSRSQLAPSGLTLLDIWDPSMRYRLYPGEESQAEGYFEACKLFGVGDSLTLQFLQDWADETNAPGRVAASFYCETAMRLDIRDLPCTAEELISVIRSSRQNLKILSLSGTILGDWRPVLLALEELPGLQSLQFSSLGSEDYVFCEAWESQHPESLKNDLRDLMNQPPLARRSGLPCHLSSSWWVVVGIKVNSRVLLTHRLPFERRYRLFQSISMLRSRSSSLLRATALAFLGGAGVSNSAFPVVQNLGRVNHSSWGDAAT